MGVVYPFTHMILNFGRKSVNRVSNKETEIYSSESWLTRISIFSAVLTERHTRSSIYNMEVS